MINLLGNAVKFTEKGFITFKVGYQQEKFRFQVEDTGMGIAQEQLEEIFLPFQQGGEKSRETEGTGLGRTISRQLVEVMGSELKVKSTLGQGSIFGFDLDLQEVDEWDNVNDWKQSISVFDFNQQQSQEVGCDGSLPKPFREAELLEKLRVHLGLEWVYEEGTVAQATNSERERKLIEESIVAPPTEEIAALLDLAMRDDLKGIVERAAHLEALNKQYVPFATHLRQLAKDFEDEKILKFVQHYKRPQ